MNRYFRLQYLSDLHLERYEKVVFPQIANPIARYLALAGNIGRVGSPCFHSFLDWASRQWDHIVYIPGHTECVGRSRSKAQLELAAACKPHSNITILNTHSPSLFLSTENVALTGLTLWPTSSVYHATDRRVLERTVDYWHRMKVPTCVITHYGPTETSARICTAKAWIHGHTNTARSGMQYGIHCATNGSGPGFTRTAYIEFLGGPECPTDDGPDAELAAAAAGIRPPALS